MKKKPYPLSLKPDLDEAAKRWEAYLAGELYKRPLVCVGAPLEGKKPPPGVGYRDYNFGDLDKIIDTNLEAASCNYYGGESIPAMGISFGADEVAVFCSDGEFHFNDDSGWTNWSKPFVDDWETALPFRIHEENPLWQRMLELCRRAAAKLEGKMLISHLDLHTNGDLLVAARSPDRLCMDLVDQPEMIDRAMDSARAIFPQIWNRVVEAAKMDERGHCQGLYSMEGAAVISCDFCCMISPEMFRRWIRPAYVEEASIVKNAFHHWDGPDALKHEADLVTIEGFHTFGYVPTVSIGGRIKHIDHLPLLRRVQKAGKAVQFIGTIDECKQAHRELAPAKTMYCTGADSVKEADDLLAWFEKNT
ncbi:MAG: hypothetical protein FWE88_03495 [Phycisphaerae bacterium]|nr:hypothetical protein [Phycisphaerae bacterium]